MNYRELQQSLKPAKQKGRTTIPLNSKKSDLKAEYDRLFLTERDESVEEVPKRKLQKTFEESQQAEKAIAYGPNITTTFENLREPSAADPQATAHVALAAAYMLAATIAAFCLVAWLVVSTVYAGFCVGLWFRRQWADLALQLNHLEIPKLPTVPMQPLGIHLFDRGCHWVASGTRQFNKAQGTNYDEYEDTSKNRAGQDSSCLCLCLQ